MKEATGELNLTVITIIAVGAVLAFFWAFWPNIKNAIQGQWNNSTAGNDNAGNLTYVMPVENNQFNLPY